MCSSMKLTRPNSSSSEFCSGVAVSSSLLRARKRLLQGVGDDVRRLVDVAQAMRFVDDDEVPRESHERQPPWSGRTGRSR